MIKKSEIIKLEDFINDYMTSASWVSWFYRTAIVPFKLFISTSPSKIQYIAISILTEEAQSLYNWANETITNRQQIILKKKIPKKFCAPIEYLIPILIKQKRVLEIKSVDFCEESAIKFSSGNKAVTLELADNGIVQIEVLINYLENYEAKLVENIKKQTSKIKEYYPISKDSALNCLKRKKLLENSLLRHQKTIQKLEDILLTLENSQTQQDFIKVTQSATIALRTLNRQTREEDIEKTIEEYRYEENISKEIDSIIADINFNKEDEKELEAELTQLVHISQPESEEIVKLLENLPTVKNKDKQKKKKKETVPLI
jgi:charged multivesicular body protein 4